MEGYSTGKSSACERALPEDSGEAETDFKQGVECKEGSVDGPVLNIQLRFQFMERGLFSFPWTLRNAGVFVSALLNMICIPQIKPEIPVFPGQAGEDSSHCYFLHRPSKKPEDFVDCCDSDPLWGQGALKTGKKAINHLPRKCT